MATRVEELTRLREQMVEQQMAARGLRDERVLQAMRSVPREAFVPARLVEFAYEDTPLPIDEEQTISQPYIVALMTEMLELEAGDRVLEIGTGSGYAAAVLAHIVDQVYTVERHASLAASARQRLQELGYANVHVHHGDGTLGWAEHAPYDAIIVAAGGPEVPQPLKQQLAIGGRLLIPVGPDRRIQSLLRVRRTAQEHFEEEDLGGVRFVPLIGTAGWEEPTRSETPSMSEQAEKLTIPEKIARAAQRFDTIEHAPLDGLLERIGNARVVLLGEASHGTAEFYEMRARITQALIEEKGFNILAVEADWPDASRIDHYIRALPEQPAPDKPFQRFPTWMWANQPVRALVDWLQEHNQRYDDPDQAVGFYGLDLYSLYASINAVVDYLEGVDPDTAALARERYGCLSPWQQDPATYGAVAVSGRYKECETEVVAALQDLLEKRLEYEQQDGRRLFNAEQNARLVANAERYYRAMYSGARVSWNLRDEHMFETLERLLEHRGPESKAVVWAHNSHIGDATFTEMSARGEFNIGQLCRNRLQAASYHVGFGTDHGTVAAASDWDGPMEIKNVRPAHPQSYERLCHASGVPAFLLPLKHDHLARREPGLREGLLEERLERAIGVIYRPETELQSHYFNAILPKQFDEYIWFDETRAVEPLADQPQAELPETFPFGV